MCACLVTSVMSNSLPTPWSVVHQAPLSVGFFRQEYWSRFLCPPPRDLPNPGIESASPVLQEPLRSHIYTIYTHICIHIYIHTYIYISTIYGDINPLALPVLLYDFLGVPRFKIWTALFLCYFSRWLMQLVPLRCNPPASWKTHRLACPCVCAQLFSWVGLFLWLPWTMAHQAPLSMVFFQARILEWITTSSSRGSSQSMDQTHISYVSFPGRQILYHCTAWEALQYC